MSTLHKNKIYFGKLLSFLTKLVFILFISFLRKTYDINFTIYMEIIIQKIAMGVL